MFQLLFNFCQIIQNIILARHKDLAILLHLQSLVPKYLPNFVVNLNCNETKLNIAAFLQTLRSFFHVQLSTASALKSRHCSVNWNVIVCCRLSKRLRLLTIEKCFRRFADVSNNFCLLSRLETYVIYHRSYRGIIPCPPACLAVEKGKKNEEVSR